MKQSFNSQGNYKNSDYWVRGPVTGPIRNNHLIARVKNLDYWARGPVTGPIRNNHLIARVKNLDYWVRGPLTGPIQNHLIYTIFIINKGLNPLLHNNAF